MVRRQLAKAFGTVNASRMLSTSCARSYGGGGGCPGGGELQNLPIKVDIGSREVGSTAIIYASFSNSFGGPCRFCSKLEVPL